MTFLLACIVPALGLYLGSPLLFWGSIIAEIIAHLWHDDNTRPPGASGVSGPSSGGCGH